MGKKCPYPPLYPYFTHSTKKRDNFLKEYQLYIQIKKIGRKCPPPFYAFFTHSTTK